MKNKSSIETRAQRRGTRAQRRGTRAQRRGTRAQRAGGLKTSVARENRATERGGAALRPSVPWRRPASARESDVKQSGSVMKRDTDQFPVAAWHHSCVAARASERIALYPPFSKGRFRGVPQAKDRVGARESGRRRPSFATRARLQREAVESSAMEGGETPSFTPSSGPVVWRHGQRLVRVASRESTTQSGDVRPSSRSLLCREATMSRGIHGPLSFWGRRIHPLPLPLGEGLG